MSIRFLSDLQHVQERPEMYTGTTETIYPLVREILDNAIDEVINGFGNSVFIQYFKKSNVTIIKDDGRGIPVNDKNYEDIPVLLATKLFSGGKFDKKLYTVTTGLHGVGLTVVNALSKYLKIITRYKKHYIEYIFKDTELVRKRIVKRKDKKWSTIIVFIPNKKFIEINLEKEMIKERLDALKTIKDNINIEFRWNNKSVKLSNILNNFIKNKVDIYGRYKDKLNLFIIGYKLDEVQRYYYGLINTLPVHKGTHLQELENKIKSDLFKIVQKQKRHIRENDLATGLRIFVSLVIDDLSFAAQHKNELTTKRAVFETIYKNVDITKILTSDQINQILDRIESYRLSIEAKKAVKTKKSSKTVHVKGLRDTNNSLPVEERELFIVEGESAGGTAITVRDVRRHAILPLRGKIQNPLNITKALQSEVIQRIFQSLGVRPLSDDLSGLRYGKVLILTDPDPDGYHIGLLLIAVFNLLLPQLIKENRLYVVNVPLYGKSTKNKFTPIFHQPSPEELESSNIHRFKGLGEMDPKELYYVALDPKSRKLTQIEFSNLDLVKQAMKEK